MFLRWMVPHPCAYEQHQLDLVGYKKKKRMEDMGKGGVTEQCRGEIRGGYNQNTN